MRGHRCPKHCHRCPDLDGDVMPGCMGTAALAHHAKDKSYCTCSHHKAKDESPRELEVLRSEVKALKAKVLRFEKSLNISK